MPTFFQQGPQINFNPQQYPAPPSFESKRIPGRGGPEDPTPSIIPSFYRGDSLFQPISPSRGLPLFDTEEKDKYGRRDEPELEKSLPMMQRNFGSLSQS